MATCSLATKLDVKIVFDTNHILGHSSDFDVFNLTTVSVYGT